MRFRILGPLEVEDAGRQLELGGPRQRAVLAFLLLNANKPVPVARLLDALWDGSTAGARNSLHSTVSRLRQLLAASQDEEAASSGSWPRGGRRWRTRPPTRPGPRPP